MASVRRDWQRKAIDLFTAFRNNFLKSILSHPFRDFLKKSQKSLETLEQFNPSHAIYSRGLNTEVIGGDADGQADRPKRFSCGAARMRFCGRTNMTTSYVTICSSCLCGTATHDAHGSSFKSKTAKATTATFPATGISTQDTSPCGGYRTVSSPTSA